MSKTISIEQLLKELEKMNKQVTQIEKVAISKTVNDIKNTAQIGMTETAVDNTKRYGRKNHHPSIPGNYPAVDTGTLRRSVTTETVEENGQVVGRVGSPLEYGLYLETGTSKMKPRKWLEPSTDKNAENIEYYIVQELEK